MIELQAKSLSKYAVDSGKSMDVDTLLKYTGSADNIYNYDRNAEFAKVILDAAEAASKARCPRVFITVFITVLSRIFQINNKWIDYSNSYCTKFTLLK